MKISKLVILALMFCFTLINPNKAKLIFDKIVILNSKYISTFLTYCQQKILYHHNLRNFKEIAKLADTFEYCRNPLKYQKEAALYAKVAEEALTAMNKIDAEMSIPVPGKPVPERKALGDIIRDIDYLVNDKRKFDDENEKILVDLIARLKQLTKKRKRLDV